VRGSDDSPLSFSYGTVPEAGSFAAEFLRISGIVNRPIVTTTNRGDGFRRALPNAGVSDLLPTLEIDYAKGGSSTLYGMPKVEAGDDGDAGPGPEPEAGHPVLLRGQLRRVHVPQQGVRAQVS